MFTAEETEKIRKSLESGNDILIRTKKNEIQIIEQKTKIIGRTDKSCLNTDKTVQKYTI